MRSIVKTSLASFAALAVVTGLMLALWRSVSDSQLQPASPPVTVTVTQKTPPLPKQERGVTQRIVLASQGGRANRANQPTTGWSILSR